jgi:hypothetical protein
MVGFRLNDNAAASIISKGDPDQITRHHFGGTGEEAGVGCRADRVSHRIVIHPHWIPFISSGPRVPSRHDATRQDHASLDG